MAKEKPFNNPFGALKARSSKAEEKAASKPVPAPAKKAKAASSADESAEFLSAMSAFDEVKPVREEPVPAPPSAKEKLSADDAESLLQLAELVAGELLVEQSAGSVLAAPSGFDATLFGKLPPKAEVDLRKAPLDRFIIDAQLRGLRSVRVLIGPEHRRAAIEALSRGKLARKVLAFRGDAESIDVLLRR